MKNIRSFFTRKCVPLSGPKSYQRGSIGSYHVCIIFDSVLSMSDSCAALVQESVAAGYNWVSILHNIKYADFFAKIESVAQATGAVFELKAILENVDKCNYLLVLCETIQNFIKNSRKDGYLGSLILLDMTCNSVCSTPGSHTKLEGILHYLSALSSVRIACLYNRALHSPEVLLDVLGVHEKIFHAGEIRDNPYFLPPALLLYGDARRKLNWWLDRLRDVTPHSTFDHLVNDHYKLESNGMVTRKVMEQESTGSWKICCLGTLRVFRHENDLIEWGSCNGATNKIKTIFAYLLQKGAQGAAPEEIADLLWPEGSNVKQGLNRLYHAIHCLRNLLAAKSVSESTCPYLLGQNGRYYLRPPHGTLIDVQVFEESCRQGELLFRTGYIRQSLSYFQEAERLYCGEVFSDIPKKYVEDRERDWCWSYRCSIEQMYLTILTCMASIYRREHDQTIALSYCMRVFKRDPCYEPAHQEAMRIYDLTGGKDAIKRQYQICCDSLRRIEERGPSDITILLMRELTGQKK